MKTITFRKVIRNVFSFLAVLSFIFALGCFGAIEQGGAIMYNLLRSAGFIALGLFFGKWI